MKKKIIRIIQIVSGSLLIILGILGLFLPFLQGFAFLIAGIILISPYHGKKLLRCLKKSWHELKNKQYKAAVKELFNFFSSGKESLKNYWSNIKSFNKGKWWLNPKKEVKEFAKTLKRGKILDIGCGMGRHTVYLAKKGFEVVAIDGAKDAVEYTKKWLKEKNLKAKVFLADFLDWHYEENEYDGILSINTFHHATEEEVRDLASKITKSIKKGGIFLANVPALRKIKSNEKQIGEQTFVPLDGPEVNIPHFLFTRKQIFEFFPEFDITVKKVKLESCDDGHFDIWALKR